MSLLPSNERILLGPGPSLKSPRVMRAMMSPTLSHLDPAFVALLDAVRGQLLRLFKAEEGSFAFAVSGTGTSGMEAVVANLVEPGKRVTVVVGGYFADRLAIICERYGAIVTRLPVEWGRAADPAALDEALRANPADIVAIVHAETSTGVLNPLQELAAVARKHNALTIVDAVTSFGGHELSCGPWGIDACYSCTQKCLGAPSGLAPVLFGPRALANRVTCRSFYLDLALLEDYWLRRKYHHTMSSALLFALYEALVMIEEEGIDNRVQRHLDNHNILVQQLQSANLTLLPPPAEQLCTLHTICVPDGVDELAVRKHLLTKYNMEIGAGLGALQGKVWRVGLMGASSSPALILLLVAALKEAVALQGR
jgi:alanine-glyoxylate transaminase/serine-glyoxylate transaminase/serine-pyruvate transaminase